MPIWPVTIALALVLGGCGSGSEEAAGAEGADATAEQQRVRRELAALGYATSLEPVPVETGVLTHDPEQTDPGLNLYTAGHAPTAILMDSNGRELHTWRYGFRDIWPDRDVGPWTRTSRAWRYAHPLPNGDLLAIFDNLGIIRLDRDSNLIWASEEPAHHDIDVLPNGDIYTLTSSCNEIPRLNPKCVLEDFITVLKPDGSLKRRFSLLEAWEGSEHREVLAEKLTTNRDLFHTNTLEYFDGSLEHLSPLYKEGNILTSFRELDTLAILDATTETVVWTLSGDWGGQHYPTLLPDGRILVFVNNAKRKASRVEILDPVSGETDWTYRGSPPRSFYSRRCGAAQWLDNGNVLVTESQAGRAFEVDVEGEIVWDFFTPHQLKTKRGAQIAYLYVLSRYPRELFASWLD